MTYVTGFFLVFAGMLIGYFLWYRDRTEEDQLQLALDRETMDLRLSLKTTENAKSILEERFTRQKGQLNVLQQLCDDWSTSREQSERDRANLEVEIENKRHRYEAAAADLQRAKQKQIELEDKIHQLTQSNLEKVHQLDHQWHKKHLLVETSLSQHQTELKATIQENEKLSRSMHQREGKIAGLQAEIDAHKKLLETATKNAGGLKREYVSLESSLKSSNDLLKQARAECATVLSEKKVAEQSLVALQSQHQKLHSEAETLRKKIVSLSSLEQDVATLRQSLAANQEQLEKVTKQRDLALKAEKTAVTMGTGLQTRLDNQESTIHGLREKHKDALEQAKRELELRTALETKLEQQRTELERRLHEQHTHKQEMTAQTASAQNRIVELERLLNDRDGRLKHESQQTISVKNRIEGLQKQLSERDDRLQIETDQVATIKTRISEMEQTLAQRNQQLTAETERLAIAKRRIVDLESKLQEREKHSHGLDEQLTTLRQQYETVQRRQADLQLQMNEHNVTQQQFESFKTDYEAKIKSLQGKLKSGEETVRQLRRERAGVLARLANYRTTYEPNATVISFKQAMQELKKTNYDREYGGHIEHHELRGVVYTSEPECRDDLKRISGIATVLEARLNDYGVYTFKQIMDWQPAAIEEFSRLLAFRERIERDDWKGQAKTLHEQKLNAKKAADVA